MSLGPFFWREFTVLSHPKDKSGGNDCQEKKVGEKKGNPLSSTSRDRGKDMMGKKLWERMRNAEGEEEEKPAKEEIVAFPPPPPPLPPPPPPPLSLSLLSFLVERDHPNRTFGWHTRYDAAKEKRRRRRRRSINFSLSFSSFPEALSGSLPCVSYLPITTDCSRCCLPPPTH